MVPRVSYVVSDGETLPSRWVVSLLPSSHQYAQVSVLIPRPREMRTSSMVTDREAEFVMVFTL